MAAASAVGIAAGNAVNNSLHSKIKSISFSYVLPTSRISSTPWVFKPSRRPLLSYRKTRSCVFLSNFTASIEQPEVTFVIIKPDGVRRGFIGEITSRFEKKGFKLKGLKLVHCSKEIAQEHYRDLRTKPFFPELVDYLSSGPVVSMAWEGYGVVASARKLIGSTNPLEAAPGTIRGDLAILTSSNVVHGSDSWENGKREIALWFKPNELC